MEKKKPVSREIRNSIALIYCTAISVSGLASRFFIIVHITSLFHTSSWAFINSIICNAKSAISTPAYIRPLALLFAWRSVSGWQLPGPRAYTPGEQPSLWLLCQLHWQSERRSVVAGHEGSTDTDGRFRAWSSTACAPPSSFLGKSPQPHPVPHQFQIWLHKGLRSPWSILVFGSLAETVHKDWIKLSLKHMLAWTASCC